MKKGIIFILLFSGIFNVSGQNNIRFKETKNIYLLDITLSMWGKSSGSTDIFDEVRKELISAITAIKNENTEIVIVTFQSKVIDVWKAKANKNGKDLLINKLKAINSKSVPKNNTNLLDPWKMGKSLMNPNKINVMFLLTDGEHSVKTPSRSDLYTEVGKWGNFSLNKDYYAFLVELVEAAKDEQLRKTIRETPKVQIINGIEFFVLAIQDDMPVINLNDELNFRLNVIGDRIESIPEGIEFTLRMLENNNFKIADTHFKLTKNSIQVPLITRNSLTSLRANLPEESFIVFKLSYDEIKFPQVKLLNNSIKLRIKNKKEMVLKIDVLDNN